MQGSEELKGAPDSNEPVVFCVFRLKISYLVYETNPGTYLVGFPAVEL
jgi:hypothetical protein